MHPRLLTSTYNSSEALSACLVDVHGYFTHPPCTLTHRAQPGTVYHGVNERGESWQEDDHAIQTQHRSRPKRPQAPRVLPKPLPPTVRTDTDGEQDQVKSHKEKEPDQRAHVGVEKLLDSAGRSLPAVLVGEVLLGGLGLAVAGNEPGLADVQLVLGEKLDQADK